MTQEPINTESSLEEQLVAYLDGELDGENCRRIEELLAVDPEVRRKLHWLEQTWEMLDELDTAPVAEDFTRTTLEMVAVAAKEDVHKGLEEESRRRRRRWFLAGGGMLVAGVTGFMTLSLIASIPNKELLQDLPVLENLDAYRQIKDIKFLRMLDEQDLFPKEECNTASKETIVRSGEDLLPHIKSLSSNQKVELLRKQNSFAGMNPADKNRVRQLQEQIQQDEHRDELYGVMERYYEWYKSLPPYNRDKLNELSAEKRIEWIKARFQEEQTKITNKPPTGKDTDALWSWMEEYATKNENKFIEGLPNWLREELSRMTPTARRQAIMWIQWQRPQGGLNKSVQLSEEDLPELRSRFSPQTQKLIEGKSSQEQVRIMQNWAHYLVRQQHGLGLGTLVNDEQLADFFEKALSDEQRDRLMNLPGEDMQRELQRLYFQSRLSERRSNRPEEATPSPPNKDGGFDRRPGDRIEKP